MALAFMRERINPSLACSPTTASEASVTDRTHLSTACMWQENRGKSITGESLLLMKCCRSSPVDVLVIGGSVMMQRISVDQINIIFGPKVQRRNL